jgi:AhpD family alkylhydroperoxidase
MTRVMANSPAVLDAYLQLSGAIGETLSPQLREKIALLAAQENACDYCVSAHTAVGRIVGIADDEIAASRRGESSDAKDAAALAFTRSFFDTKGAVSDADLAAIRDAGYADGEIAEIAGNAIASIFTNYFNRLAQTEIDFPKVEL